MTEEQCTEDDSIHDPARRRGGAGGRDLRRRGRAARAQGPRAAEACASAPPSTGRRATGRTRRRSRSSPPLRPISPENLLKWEAVHPEPDRYDFGPADRYVELGRSHGMFVVGHVLLWHQQTPAWVFAGEGGKKARPRDAARPPAEPRRDGRRPLPGPDRRLGRRQRGPRGGRDAAADALARGDRRGLHREGLRVRARGRPRRRALLQRLQPLEAGQAGRRRSASSRG